MTQRNVKKEHLICNMQRLAFGRRRRVWVSQTNFPTRTLNKLPSEEESSIPEASSCACLSLMPQRHGIGPSDAPRASVTARPIQQPPTDYAICIRCVAACERQSDNATGLPPVQSPAPGGRGAMHEQCGLAFRLRCLRVVQRASRTLHRL